VSQACPLFLVPSRSSNPPLYPSKGCELGSVLRLLLIRCFLLGLTFEPFKELGVRHFGFDVHVHKLYQRYKDKIKSANDGRRVVSHSH